MDANKDGAISFDEVLAAKPAELGEVTEEDKVEAEGLFKQFDVNGDGKIEKDEVRQVLAKMLGPMFEPLVNEVRNKMKEAVETLFKSADANGDDKLDEAEYEVLHAQMKETEPFNQWAEDADDWEAFKDFKAADTDGDGFLDMEEFRRHCLLNGLDDIGLTLQSEADITAFEERMVANTPWL